MSSANETAAYNAAKKHIDALVAKDDRALARRHYAIDYSSTPAYENVALYTPALSEGWIRTIERSIEDAKLFEWPKLPDFDLAPQDLQFTNPDSRLCFYPWVLYSAGQVAGTDSGAAKNNWVTHQPRDPRVVVLGDSGGFQVQQGTIKFEGSRTTKRILSWLERVADYSMVLDFPTGGISSGIMVEHTKRLISQGEPIEQQAKAWGFDTGFVSALTQTQKNNHDFVRHRVRGKTRLLNVLQGRNERESRFWYDRVKRYPFEGWAFAGRHHTQLSMTLRRLIQMRDDKLISKCKWLHFLGISKLDACAALTLLQRAVRHHTDAAEFQISFDSKSPVDGIIHGTKPTIGFKLDPSLWAFRSEAIPADTRAIKDLTLWEIGRGWADETEHGFAPATGIGTRAQIRDLMEVGPKTKFNAFHHAMIVHHNTQMYFEAFREVYKRLSDKDRPQRPESIQFLEYMLDAIFSSEKPMSVIDEAAHLLDAREKGKF